MRPSVSASTGVPSWRVPIPPPLPSSFFFFNDTATTEIYTLSLHDALPISKMKIEFLHHYHARHGYSLKDKLIAYLPRYAPLASRFPRTANAESARPEGRRSEEHTSELQSLTNLVCRLLLEKKKNMLLSTWL